jgi:hypothetical protein
LKNASGYFNDRMHNHFDGKAAKCESTPPNEVSGSKHSQATALRELIEKNWNEYPLRASTISLTPEHPFSARVSDECHELVSPSSLVDKNLSEFH